MKNYFTIAEMTRSAVAKAHGIDNTIPEAWKRKAEELITHVLNPLREAYGKPITVNSGYRCPALNQKVGGSPTSDHLRGAAADITGGSPGENKKLFDLAKKLNLPYKQLIDEKHYSWVHVSYDGRAEKPKRQILHL